MKPIVIGCIATFFVTAFLMAHTVSLWSPEPAPETLYPVVDSSGRTAQRGPRLPDALPQNSRLPGGTPIPATASVGTSPVGTPVTGSSRKKGASPKKAQKPLPRYENPRPERLMADLEKLGSQGLQGLEGEEFNRILEWVVRAKEDELVAFGAALRADPRDLVRFLGTAALAFSEHKAAVGTLAESLTDDDLLVRRAASNALARHQTPEATAALEGALDRDPDMGVRLNSAFALALRGNDRGLEHLVAAHRSPETPENMKTNIFWMLTQVDDERVAPVFREVLADDRNPDHQLLALGMLEKLKDPGALPVIADKKNAPDTPGAMRELMQNSYDSIRNP